MWFCLAMNALSTILNTIHQKDGFIVKGENNEKISITRLLYMDDLKLYGRTEISLRKLVRTTENFSNDIKMKFGMDKCCIQNIRNGRIDQREQEGNGDRVDEQMHMMGPNDVYKYLGYEQNRRTEHAKIKQNLRETFQKRVRKIAGTKLNSRNLTKAINTFAIPLLTYSFGVI